MFIYINFELLFIDTGEMIMERIVTLPGEWACTGDDYRQTESVGSKVLAEVLGIIKDTVVMSVVVMAGAALTLWLW